MVNENNNDKREYDYAEITRVPHRNNIILQNLGVRINKTYYGLFEKQKENDIIKEPENINYDEKSQSYIIAISGAAFGILTTVPYLTTVAAYAMQKSSNLSDYASFEMLIKSKINEFLAVLNNSNSPSNVFLFAAGGIVAATSSIWIKDIIKKNLKNIKGKKTIQNEDIVEIAEIEKENIDSILDGFINIDDIKKTLMDIRSDKKDSGIIFVKDFLCSVDLSKMSRYINEVFLKLVEIRKEMLNLEKSANKEQGMHERRQNKVNQRLQELCDIMYKVDIDPNISKDYKINEEYINNIIEHSKYLREETHDNERRR